MDKNLLRPFGKKKKYVVLVDFGATHNIIDEREKN